MDATIAAILTLDGVSNGAIYALLALATVLLFAVTRVIFIPQGEFVADTIRRGQEQGGILAGRDADAEAWIFISLGLLSTIDHRLGSIVGGEFDDIIASRREWMTGKAK